MGKRASAGLGMPSLRELYKGSGSLLVASGPMVVVQDTSTAATVSVLDRWLPPTQALCASACISGGVGALVIGCQIEGIITRAHSTGRTVTQTVVETRASQGVAGLVMPYGAWMIAGREVPYAGCLFFLSGWVRSKMHGESVIGAAGESGGGAAGGAAGSSAARYGRDLVAAAVTAAIAGPLSHAPSVVASTQQAHNVTIREACSMIWRADGLIGFFRGVRLRTISLTGSMFVMPLTIETLQPLVERYGSYRHKWRPE